MARIGENARLRVRINETTTADVSGITKNSPLEEQAMLLWYTAHAMIKRNTDHTEFDDGVNGPLNMHNVVRTVFHLDNPDASRLSALIRQVFKKTNTAKCTRLAKNGNDPEWWIANSMPDDIVTVAQWVAAHPHVAEAGSSTSNKAPKPTKAEERLTPHEVGEDRQPEPVTVTKKTTEEGPAVTSEALEVVSDNGPIKTPSLQKGATGTELAKFREKVHQALHKIFKEYGPVTAFEAQYLLNRDNNMELEISTVRDYINNLVDNGKLYGRGETTMERSLRQLRDRTAYWGKYSTLYSTRSHFAERDFAVDRMTGEIYKFTEGMDMIPVPKERTDPRILLRSTPEPVTVTMVKPKAKAKTEKPVQPEPENAVDQMILGAVKEMMANVAALTKSETDDLKTMNELLEEENARLVAEVTDLKAQIERAKAAFN